MLKPLYLPTKGKEKRKKKANLCSKMNFFKKISTMNMKGMKEKLGKQNKKKNHLANCHCEALSVCNLTWKTI
jgi:hypothetical protein